MTSTAITSLKSCARGADRSLLSWIRGQRLTSPIGINIAQGARSRIPSREENSMPPMDSLLEPRGNSISMPPPPTARLPRRPFAHFRIQNAPKSGQIRPGAPGASQCAKRTQIESKRTCPDALVILARRVALGRICACLAFGTYVLVRAPSATPEQCPQSS